MKPTSNVQPVHSSEDSLPPPRSAPIDSLQPAWTRHVEPILLFVVVGLAAALRFYALNQSSLWSDEGNTWALIQRSFAQIARDAAADIHPPGYYWLLKLWSTVAGTSVVAMRSFSAVTGVLTVAMIAAVAHSFRSRRHARFLFPTLAAFVAAVNPFQIYYSQEARMYMLLALEATILLWATVTMARRHMDAASARSIVPAGSAYVVAGIAGLWTHYSFPIVLAAAGLGYLWAWAQSQSNALPPEAVPASQRQGEPVRPRPLRLWPFLLMNVLVVVAFLPWLPTALTRVLSWPKGGAEVTLADGIAQTLRTLLVGPLQSVPDPLWPWLMAAAIVPLLGAAALWRQRASQTIMLMLLLPVALMFGLGLFSAAFMKFLLVASPAWCLLTAATPHLVSLERAPDDINARAETRVVTLVLQAMIAVGVALLAILVLPAYYSAADARDNYKGLATYIGAVADPSRDMVLLNAPGQREVWSYYDPGIPVLALPAMRPPDAEATQATLQQATADARTIYALFWATDEADPQGIVESWLDQHAFKGLESWQGNLRLAVYALADELVCAKQDAIMFGQAIQLNNICIPPAQAQPQPGETLLVELQWQARPSPAHDYVVSVQLLDAANQVVAQHDSEPAGGTQPTSTWAPDVPVSDRHALLIPIGTPPGTYQLVVTLYDPVSGVRLPVANANARADALDAGVITVTAPARAIPAEVVPVAHRVNKDVGPVRLVGYDLFKQGFAHAPETPVTAGDVVQVILYWELPSEMPDDISAQVSLGGQVVETPLARAATALDGNPQILRTLVALPYDGTEPRPVVEVGATRVELAALPQ